MIIKSIELSNYRNYRDLNIAFDSGTNILYGDNAQGKTNVLESIYLMSTTKSHKGSKDRDIINFNSDEAHIKGILEKRGSLYRIDMHLKKNKNKGIAINGLQIIKASELFGILNVVFFSPEDLNIIKNGPSERRRFMDIELCQLSGVYVHNLSNYNKIVNQRNKLLKDIQYNQALIDTLDVWDEQLLIYGKKVIEGRENFINQLKEIIHGIHYNLSGKKEELILQYEKNTSCEEFEINLKRNRDRDLKMKMTTTGPHRDDLSFIVNGIDIRTFGSQGQQRTSALSLKLSEIELVKIIIKDTPILLLDDVLSELDANRQNHLLSSIKDIQTIITCTGLDEFVNNRFNIDKIYKVIDGTISSEN